MQPGLAGRAVAAEELGAVAGDGSLRLARVEERDAIAELAVVGVAGEQRPGLRIDLGDDVRQVCRAVRPEHQLEEAR